MRDSLNPHSRFAELCALEMVNQLSPQERLELFAHCSSCPECEAWLFDAHAISSQLLISHQFSVKSEAVPIGAETRFAAEAHRRGISVPHSQGSVYLSRIKLTAAATVLVALGMAMGFFLRQATHSATQEAAVRSGARPEAQVERSTLLLSPPVPASLNREPPFRRVTPRRTKRETRRPPHLAQQSPLTAWSSEPNHFQMRPVLFDFSDCCHFVPQKPGLVVHSPDLPALRNFPRLGGVWPLASSPERIFRYEAALLPIGASVSPTQPRSVAFPSPQFPPFHLNLEHTR